VNSILKMLVEKHYEKELNRRIKQHMQMKLIKSRGKITKLVRSLSVDFQNLLEESESGKYHFKNLSKIKNPLCSQILTHFLQSAK
jgi:hypothetical protein